MSSLPLGMMIEGLVAVLLVVTIGYCWLLNHRLQRLRADEETLRATISELMTATEIAERAIIGLKTTAADVDHSLGARLMEAEKLSGVLCDQVEVGENIFHRISQIAETVRGATAERDAAARDAAAREAAAQAAMLQRQGYGYERPAPRAEAPVQGDTRGYGYEPHVGNSAGAPAAGSYRRNARADDIRSAAAEAAARVERFRKRSGGAVA